MANNRRDQRRQGVVYGPVFPPPGGRGSAGVWIGRLLGVFVVVLAFGVLGIGIYTFVGQRGATVPSGSPSPSASPTPTLLPVAPSPEPIPTPTPTIPPLTPVPTPSLIPSTASASPELSAPPVEVGAGWVTFGTQIDETTLHIIDPKSVFGPNERTIWASAHLSATALSDDLTIQILKVDPSASNGQVLVREQPVTPLGVTGEIFQLRIRPQDMLQGAGIYHVRYMRSDNLLSEGYFEITG